MKASVGTCTVPKFRIFFLPAPHKSKLLWGPRIRFKWPEMNSACGKVLLRKTLVTPHRRR